MVDGQLSHLLPVDMVIVLRADPKVLKRRLSKRDYTGLQLNNSLQAEKNETILKEARKNNRHVFEVDTTEIGIMDTANLVSDILNGHEKLSKGC